MGDKKTHPDAAPGNQGKKPVDEYIKNKPPVAPKVKLPPPKKGERSGDKDGPSSQRRTKP